MESRKIIVSGLMTVGGAIIARGVSKKMKWNPKTVIALTIVGAAIGLWGSFILQRTTEEKTTGIDGSNQWRSGSRTVKQPKI